MRKVSSVFIPFGVSAILLLSELTFVNIFNAVFHPWISFFIITVALAGIGLGGFLESVLPEKWDLQSLGIGFGAFLLGAFRFLLNRLEFSEAGHLVLALSWAVLMGTLLLFFSALGLSLVRSFGGGKWSFAVLYSADFMGGALGVFSAQLFLGSSHPGAILLACASVLLVLLAVSLEDKKWAAASLSAGFALLLLSLSASPRDMEFLYKMKRFDSAKVEFSHWNLLSKLDVVDEPPNKAILYDGGVLRSTIYPFDGDFGALKTGLARRIGKEFWTPGAVAPHLINGGPQAHSLIIGAAGGQEIKAALLFEEGRIDVAELIAPLFNLGTDRYRAFNGGIFLHPAVNLHVSEGRAFLRQNPKERYDIIQIFSAHTTTFLSIGGGGVRTALLMTREAFREYFSHLNDRGILQVTHPFFPRQIATAAEVWRSLGKTEFRKHVLVFDSPELADIIPTVLIRMTPWTEKEVGQIAELFRWGGDYRLVENPLDPKGSFLSDDFYRGEQTDFLRSLAYDVSPTSDDKPYFKFVRRSIFSAEASGDRAFATSSIRQYLDDKDFLNYPVDSGILVLTAEVLLLFGALVVGLIWYWKRKRCPPAVSVSRGGYFYFILLGAGFSIVELSLMFLCAPLVGNPQWSLIAVLSALLFGCSFGSLASAKIARTRHLGQVLVFALIFILGALLPQVVCSGAASFGWLSAQPILTRVASVFGLCFCLGIFLGIPFPLQIASFREGKAILPLAWLLSGYSGLVAGFLATIVSVSVGNRMLLMGGLFCYLLATLFFVSTGRGPERQVSA